MVQPHVSSPARDAVDVVDGHGEGVALPEVRSVYQPVVHLDTLDIVGFEALARGPQGSDVERPDAMFAAARAAGVVSELDWACRISALTGALQQGLSAPLTLFVNVEPEALAAPTPHGAHEVLHQASEQLTIVMEITERALTSDPAGLLRAVDGARERGWRIALDDVGAERASLALLPFVSPDVIKLDLRLVQARTTVEIAEIVTAVSAHAEGTGALVLAEGIETPAQARLAEMMGATLGQGWLFGRPGPLPAHRPAPPARSRSATPRNGADLPRVAPPAGAPAGARSPFELVAGPHVRRSTKQLLLAISRQLERQAWTLGDSGVVLSTFERSEHFTPLAAQRYADLAATIAFVGAFGTGVADHVVPGVRGCDPGAGHPVNEEWDVIVVGPHFAAALLARDLGDEGPQEDRRFDYRVTYDRATVLAAATMLMRLVPAETPVQHGLAVAAGTRA